jgi:HSP20 family molecular chaperone IbpA
MDIPAFALITLPSTPHLKAGNGARTGPFTVSAAMGRRQGRCERACTIMNRTVYFNSPFLLGFDHLETLLERAAKSAADSYPPYNIEQTGADALRITLAVAGFTEDELSVTVEDRQLVIRGRQSDSEDKTYLHRGIAARQFQRAFVLAEGIEIAGASLANGLLTVDLMRPEAQSVVRTIAIKAEGDEKGGQR